MRIHFTGRAALVASLVLAVGTLLVTLALLPTAAAPPAAPAALAAEQHVATYVLWNATVESIKRENALLTELQDSLKTGPPEVVTNMRRAYLYAEVVREHRLRIEAYRKMYRLEFHRELDAPAEVAAARAPTR